MYYTVERSFGVTMVYYFEHNSNANYFMSSVNKMASEITEKFLRQSALNDAVVACAM